MTGLWGRLRAAWVCLTGGEESAVLCVDTVEDALAGYGTDADRLAAIGEAVARYRAVSSGRPVPVVAVRVG